MDISNIKGMLSVPTERLKITLDTIEVAKKMLIEVSEHYHYRYSEDYMKEIADELDDASTIISMINNGYMVQEVQDSDADIVNNCTTRCQEATESIDTWLFQQDKIGNNNGYTKITDIQKAIASSTKGKSFTVDAFDDIFDSAMKSVCYSRSLMLPSTMYYIVKENASNNNIYASLYLYYNDEIENKSISRKMSVTSELFNIKGKTDSIIRYTSKMSSFKCNRDQIYCCGSNSISVKFKYDVNLEYSDGTVPDSISKLSAYIVVFVNQMSSCCPLAVIGIKKIDMPIKLVPPYKEELAIEYNIY